MVRLLTVTLLQIYCLVRFVASRYATSAPLLRVYKKGKEEGRRKQGPKESTQRNKLLEGSRGKAPTICNNYCSSTCDIV